MTKKKILILAVPLLIVIALLGVNLHEKWQYDHPLSHSKYGFQPYKPQKLPNGQRITASRMSVSQSNGKVYGISVGMNLRPAPHNWVYSISERRAHLYEGDTQRVTTGLRNFDASSKEPTCTQRVTPEKRSYRLCHWTDYERINVYEVNFIQEKTFISTKFPANIDHSIAAHELDEYVDSFVPSEPPKEIVRGI